MDEKAEINPQNYKIITKIGEGAFGKVFKVKKDNKYYALKKIVIPENVSDIDDTAFDGCEKLTIQCKKGSYADEFAKKNGIKTAYM